MKRHVLILFASCATCLPASWVSAQLAPGTDGRALDANNQVGSGGLNRPVRTASPGFSNYFITGNVAGGRAFQAFSPVRDPSSLFLDLPSAELDTFRRDAIGMSDVLAGRTNWQVQAYFGQSNVVTNAGGIAARLNRPGTTVPQDAFAAPRLDLTPLPALSGAVPSGGFGAVSGAKLTDDPFGTGSGSTGDSESINLFERLIEGARRPNAYLSPLFEDAVPARDVRRLPATMVWPGGERIGRQGPSASGPGSEAAVVTGLRPLYSETSLFAREASLLSPGALAPRLYGTSSEGESGPITELMRRPPEPMAPAPRRPRGLFERPAPDSAAAEGEAPAGQEEGAGSPFPTLMPPDQGDVYARARQALAWLSRTSRRHAQADGSEGAQPGEFRTLYEQAMRDVRNLLREPRPTYVGDANDRIATYVRRAETQLRNGAFFRAASSYRLALTLDRGNPLIMLGLGNALFGAGEYLSAVRQLTRALETLPAVAALRQDLTQFVTDPTALDYRRADLENRLSRREDHRLRFLLGYAEYYSGLEKFGRQNLIRAAELAPPNSSIARIPQLLELAMPEKELPKDTPLP